jgi:hypothetical protein
VNTFDAEKKYMEEESDVFNINGKVGSYIKYGVGAYSEWKLQGRGESKIPALK